MATTTPNYGWPVPTSTDYVKDGATAIEALGDAIDATVFGLGSGPDVMISKGTFTTSSAVNLSSVLNSSYNFYTLNVYANGSSAGAALNLRFRENTTDFTSANYAIASQYYQTGGGVGTYSSSGSATTVQLANMSTGARAISNINLAIISATEGSLTYQSWDSNSNQGITGAVRNNALTNFNGLSLYPSAGTFTGYYILTGRKV
jgi:hypothetical protein